MEDSFPLDGRFKGATPHPCPSPYMGGELIEPEMGGELIEPEMGGELIEMGNPVRTAAYI